MPSLSPFLRQCTVALGASLNSVLHGAGFGLPAVLLPRLRAAGPRLSSAQESWVASILAVALFTGNLLATPAMRRGRRPAQHLVSALNIAGYLVIALADSFQVLMIGRFIQGASIGLFLPAVGVILGEYCSPAHRGALLATISVGQAFGSFLVHLVGSFLDWRDTVLLLSFFPLISIAITIVTPESPSWLALESRYDECREAFRWLRGLDEEHELEELIRARQHVDSQPKTGGTCRETVRAFSRRELYIPLILGLLMYMIVVDGGSVMLASYMTEILRVFVGPDCEMYRWMGACDIARVLFNGAALAVVARLPRRALLLSTGAANVVAYLAQASYVCARDADLIDNTPWLAALLLLCFIATIGLGTSTVPVVILGEIFPLQYRSVCSSLSNVAMSATSFVVLKTFPGLTSALGLAGAYALYAGCMAAALAAAAALLPETRGRTLQQVEDRLREATVPLARAREMEPLRSRKSDK